MVFPVAHLTKVTFGELAVMSGPWIFSGRLTVCASSDAVCVVEREISRPFFGSHEIRELPLILEVVQMDIPCRIIKELVFATLMGTRGRIRESKTLQERRVKTLQESQVFDSCVPRHRCQLGFGLQLGFNLYSTGWETSCTARAALSERDFDWCAIIYL